MRFLILCSVLSASLAFGGGAPHDNVIDDVVMLQTGLWTDQENGDMVVESVTRRPYTFRQDHTVDECSSVNKMWQIHFAPWEKYGNPVRKCGRGLEIRAFSNWTKYPLLEPKSDSFIARAFFLGLAVVLPAMVVGKLWQRSLQRRVLEEKDAYQHVSRTALLFILAAYVVFIPAVYFPMIGYSIDLHVPISRMHQRMYFGINVIDPVRLVKVPSFKPPKLMVSESLQSVLELFWKQKAMAAWGLSFFYGFIVPWIKLLAFVVIFVIVEKGKLVDASERTKRWLHRIVWFVRFVSKWDAPKLFAYVILNFLVKGLHDMPRLSAASHLDAGFALYFIFSVGTLLASIFHHDFLPDEASSKLQVSSTGKSAPWSPKALAKLVSLLATVYFALFLTGALLPFTSMKWIPKTKQFERLPGLKHDIEILRYDSYVEYTLFGLVHQASQDVNSVPGAVNAWLILAIVLGFTVMLPLLSMVSLVYATFKRWRKSENSIQRIRSAIWWADMCDYLGMLDVCLLGVALTKVNTAQVFGKAGCTMCLHSGFWVLLAAQLWMWFGQWILSRDGTFEVEQEEQVEKEDLVTIKHHANIAN